MFAPHRKHTCRLPVPLMRISLLFCMFMMFVPHRKHPSSSIVCYAILYVYVDGVPTSQETHLWASMACFGDSFTFLYADEVHISQENTHGPLQTVKMITLLFICRGCSYLTGNHLWVSTACYRDSFTLLYVADVRTSEETHPCASTVCYRDSYTLFICR
jgi:hypothetical protein